MDLSPVLRELSKPATLQVLSDASLAYDVEAKAKQARAEAGGGALLKSPSPVDVPGLLRIRAADVLRELGVATTFLSHSPFREVAQLWAHVRYCATLRHTGRGLLSLTDYAATDVVHHHKVAQSEQLGVGLALVVTRAVLGRRHPGCDFRAVDADVALAAGYVDELPGEEVVNASETRKRPDYFLIGRHRGKVRVVVLECKGTHQSRSHVIEQLGTACLQLRTVAIGRRRLYGLMVGSQLSRSGITSYVLDPPGDDELWEGSEEELDALLEQEPDQLDWSTVSPATPSSANATAAAAPASPDGTQEPEPPAPYSIPPARSGWFTQVLARSTAAKVLMYAGDSSAAATYLTPRQRGFDANMIPALEEEWPDSRATTMPLPRGPVVTGTSFRMPLADGSMLEVFRGVERQLHLDLTEGRFLAYQRRAGILRQWWHARGRHLSGETVSVGNDGTALVIRIVDRRGE